MITIIIVTYNSERFIKKCIDSVISNTKRVIYEIIVVDNNSCDKTVEIVYRSFPEVRLVRNKRNIGFGAANNIAIDRSSGELILFLNPDTILQNDAVSELAEFLDKNNEVGCAGSKLVYYDGTLQLSCRKFPNFINVFFGRRSIMRHLFPHNPVSREFMLENMDYSNVQMVDWVMGAAMIVRRSVIQYAGKFDEQFFLFVEDTDLCYRIRKSGKSIAYVPHAVIKHYHGASVRKGFSAALFHHNIGMYKFFRKYFISRNKLLDFLLYCAILMRLTVVFFLEQGLLFLNMLKQKTLKENQCQN